MKPKNRLQQERALNRLDIKQLTEYLYGGPERYKLHQRALEYVLKSTDFLKEDYGYDDLSRADKRKRAFKSFVAIKKVHDEIKDPDLLRSVMRIISSSRLGSLSRYGLSVYFFGEGIRGQGTQEQIVETAQYLPYVCQELLLQQCRVFGRHLQSLELMP